MGKVYLVGAGPGDPGLLTVKALRILQIADVVLHDRLVSAEILRLCPNALLIDGGKQQGDQERIQDDINRRMLSSARTGLNVVRLKGGDPMVFARGAEEREYLIRHGVEVEVVPGVSSALAVPALAGIPPTCRGLAASFAVIAGHRQHLIETDWSQYARVDTLIVLMGVENRDLIAENLIRMGRDSAQPVAFIEHGSTPRERVIESSLAAVAAGNVEVEPPAVIVMGEVVRLRSRWERVRELNKARCA
jgi:uroporphyrin-III C-methyltransferase